jgi:superfamily II DNA or RNA helicase
MADTYFTDKDQLLLLQLTTRRAMAERQRRAASKKSEALQADNTREPIPAQVSSPLRWRLLAEGTSLYDWQRDALPLWLSEGRGTVKVATGGGKTLFALAVAERLQNERESDLRLVVVVPTIPLMFQWYDELLGGNLPESAIALMGGGREVPRGIDPRILICVLASARDRLPGFVARMRWSQRMLLVVDECHRASAEQARRIFDAKPRYTLGLSATPEQDEQTESLPSDEAYEKSVVGQALGPII